MDATKVRVLSEFNFPAKDVVFLPGENERLIP